MAIDPVLARLLRARAPSALFIVLIDERGELDVWARPGSAPLPYGWAGTRLTVDLAELLRAEGERA